MGSCCAAPCNQLQPCVQGLGQGHNNRRGSLVSDGRGKPELRHRDAAQTPHEKGHRRCSKCSPLRHFSGSHEAVKCLEILHLLNFAPITAEEILPHSSVSQVARRCHSFIVRCHSLCSFQRIPRFTDPGVHRGFISFIHLLFLVCALEASLRWLMVRLFLKNTYNEIRGFFVFLFFLLENNFLF